MAMGGSAIRKGSLMQMKKPNETSTATADAQSSRNNKSSANANGTLRLSVETVPIKQLKFEE
jgi:hypothetical protein